MFPRINQNIVVEVLDKEQSFRSIIGEIRIDELLIGLPMDNSSKWILPNGTKLAVTYFTGDNQYKFPTEIIGRTMENIPLYILKKPREKEITRIQRRNNFRVSTQIPIILDDKEYFTLNISAGGTLFACPASSRFQEGQELAGVLHIPTSQNNQTEPVTFKGRVKRIKLLETQEIKNIGLEFLEIDQRQENKLMKYCFDIQRKNR